MRTVLLRTVLLRTVPLLTLALAACGPAGLLTAPALSEHHTTVDGMPVTVRVVPPTGESAGAAIYLLGHCTIAIAQGHEHDPHLLAHELGHCADAHHLNWTHNGWRDGDGCVYGRHYCPAHEGYAEGYARAYREACGAAAPIALEPAAATCNLPAAEAVTRPTGPDPREMIPHLP